MKIELNNITIRDISRKFIDSQEDGVIGYDSKLNIRPAYQREFIYKSAQRLAVIETVLKGFPLNVMYWAANPDGTFEVIDGQQRTISICQFISGVFSLSDGRYFYNMTQEEQESILDYQLQIYICTGTDKDKLGWFETINIAGEKLTEQELRNAIYTGVWLADAKKHFSKSGCPAFELAEEYMIGTPIRQDYLQTVLKWVSNDHISDYMATHQHDKNASELWAYFQRVIGWTKSMFPVYRREMKGIDWGLLYNKFRNTSYNPTDNEERIKVLMMDDDVTNKKGIYKYILDGQEKHLNIRQFSNKMKREVYERQAGICVSCQNKFEFGEMEGDHITPWHDGGTTSTDNLQMLCKACNRVKGGK